MLAERRGCQAQDTIGIMPTPLPPIPDLVLALRQLIDQVPRGRVTTPGTLAAALGNPIAARWIGHYLLHHDHVRTAFVIAFCGPAELLGPYPEGDDEKVRRLRARGSGNGRRKRRSGRYGYGDFTSDRPLEKLADYQNRVAAKVSLPPAAQGPAMVGGVDVSYVSPQEGVAAYALVEVATGELLWSTTIRRAVRFPYISSYLTFRELPLLMELIDEVRAQDRIAPVILVDGTGILHPRRAGIACHLGVVTGLPTIGVTKKLLCGQVDIDGLQPLESRPVVLRRSTHRRGDPADFRQPPAAVHFAGQRTESGIRGTDCPSGPQRATTAIAPLLGGSFEPQTCENLAIKRKLFSRSMEIRGTGR